MISVFEKLTVKQIILFSEIIRTSTLLDIEFIQTKYLRDAPNFEETISFLLDLRLIEISNAKIIPLSTYRQFLIKLSQRVNRHIIIRDFFVNRLLASPIYRDYAIEFLARFHFIDGKLEFAPNSIHKTDYSGLRNFLMELGFIKLDATRFVYVIVEPQLLNPLEYFLVGRMSPEAFQHMQEKNNDVGKAAELAVLEYEKKRLHRFPDLVEKIEHIAVKAVNAGYDIRSYEEVNLVVPKERLIEVKAVSQWDFLFHWTRNEIEKAKDSKDRYYLYLVPSMEVNRFDINSMKIIQNPFNSILGNQSVWTFEYERIICFLNQN